MRVRRNIFLQCLAVALTVIPPSIFASAAETRLPKPSSATYQAEYNGHRVTASRTYTATTNGGWTLRFTASSWFASVEESSQFHWNADGEVLSDRYFYKREILGRDRINSADFDYNKGVARTRKEDRRYTVALDQLLLDKQNYQIQLRHDLINDVERLSYPVLDGKRIKLYQFQRMGEETIQTPLGPLTTVKVERVREDSKRETRLWFAKDWDFMVIKLVQEDEDDQRFQIDVIDLTVDGVSATRPNTR